MSRRILSTSEARSSYSPKLGLQVLLTNWDVERVLVKGSRLHFLSEPEKITSEFRFVETGWTLGAVFTIAAFAFTAPSAKNQINLVKILEGLSLEFFLKPANCFLGCFNELEYQTSSDFEWLKVVRMLNGSDFERHSKCQQNGGHFKFYLTKTKFLKRSDFVGAPILHVWYWSSQCPMFCGVFRRFSMYTQFLRL